MGRIIIVYLRPDNTYYFRFVKGTYKNYFIGYENQYSHKVVLIINDPYIGLYSHVNYPRMYLRRLVGWLYKRI